MAGGSRETGRLGRIGRVAGAVVVLGGVAGLALFAGFEIGERDLFPHKLFELVDRKLEKTIFPRPPAENLVSQTFPSHLIKIEAGVGIVETANSPSAHAVSEKGGGLTSFGADVLLLPYDGRIYAASSASDIRATRIVGPDNNRAAYQALAEDPDFAEYEMRKGYLRYHDLIHFERAAGRGLFASYTEYHPDRQCVTNTVARLDIDRSITTIDAVEAGPGDWKVVYRTAPCLPFKKKYLALEGHMAGGRMAFEAPSTLYLTSGDFHLDGMRSEAGPGIAQDPAAEYGKVLAIDTDTGAGRILSMGHRNMQGIVLMADGALFVIEHGPRGGDELNLIREGTNYGWPLESYGVTYKGNSRIPGSLSYGRHETFEAPVFSWVPSVATSSATYIENFHPAWDGDLLVGSLIDQSLHRLRMAGDRVVYRERIEIGARIRDLHQHTDGRIVLWTDNNELIFLTGADRSNRAVIFAEFVRWPKFSERVLTRLETVLAGCAECHSFEVDDHERAPSLARIHGDAVAATTYDNYSDALRGHGGDWTDENLTAFLSDPQGFAPGTEMPSPEIEDAEVIQALISYLERLDSAF